MNFETLLGRCGAGDFISCGAFSKFNGLLPEASFAERSERVEPLEHLGLRERSGGKEVPGDNSQHLGEAPA